MGLPTCPCIGGEGGRVCVPLQKGLPSEPHSPGLGKEPLAEAKVKESGAAPAFPPVLFVQGTCCSRLARLPSPAGQPLNLHVWHRCSKFRWFPVGLFHLPSAGDGKVCHCHRYGRPHMLPCAVGRPSCLAKTSVRAARLEPGFVGDASACRHGGGGGWHAATLSGAYGRVVTRHCHCP